MTETNYKGRKPAYSAEATDVGKRIIYEKILELRESVLRHEVSINSIATRFGVSRNTVHRILKI
ncbi:helix-turn-helix domain-containing protein [Lactobacillus sp. CRM56-3]|uniref:Helix-turn-helix domain-containing protein n=1 Tax=Secundilactobacillus folii TaxID=2678357 RepID=A0A7X2XYS1_9LACO|nr:helix-turn-helix domain-containing protein [Secundilactobacillus folii]